MMQIMRMTRATEWKRLRSIRLRCLRDTPDAFGMTFEEESKFDSALWRSRLEAEDSATFIATQTEGNQHSEDVGLITGAAIRGGDQACGLYSMWVSLEYRRSGLALRLIDSVVSWARSGHYQRILLDVGDDNQPAIRLYERCGFQPTGNVSTLRPPRTHIREHERELWL